jgi:hypothetical protein
MGEYLLNLILTNNLPIVQLALIAYVGALFGEMKREIDDQKSLIFWRFMVSWLSSGFGGIMIGLAVRGVVRDNEYFSMAGAGIAGYAGYEKTMNLSFGFLDKLLEAYAQRIVNNSNKKDDS